MLGAASTGAWAQRVVTYSTTEGAEWKQGKTSLANKAEGVTVVSLGGDEEGVTFRAWGTTFNELDWDAFNLLTRNEQDEVRFLSGIFEGRSTGTPIAFVIENSNNRIGDYDNLREAFRPSHADYVYDRKYGVRDHRGGGRSSARETAVRVCAGALAKLALSRLGITVQAYTSQVGDILLDGSYACYDLSLAETNAVRCPDAAKAAEMEQLILDVKRGDIGSTAEYYAKEAFERYEKLV